MRISDWSSDVCSSDLYSPDGRERCAVRDGPGYGIMPCGRAAPLSPCALILAMADERAPSMNQSQAEQTTTAPVSLDSVGREARRVAFVQACWHRAIVDQAWDSFQIGRASCRERVCQDGLISVVPVSLK